MKEHPKKPETNEKRVRTTPSTLLVVDDEENILSALKRIFRPKKYNVLTATSGIEGINILRKNKVDLIISDMRMPKMTGDVFLKEAKKLRPETIRILMTGYADMSSTVEAINEGEIFKYIAKPWDENDLLLTVKLGLERKSLEEEAERLHKLTQEQNNKLKSFNEELEKLVNERTEDLQKAMEKLESSNQELKTSFISSIQIFTNLIETRGGKTMSGHLRKVAEHAKKVAIEMGLHKDEVQNILLAGLLHDIGKIVLPDTLLKRAFLALNKEEREAYIRHPIIGQGALLSLSAFEEVGKIIRSHHELYDGNGYPDGISGNDIPIGSRIIAVVNDFYSLQEGTLVSQRMTQKEALSYIERNKRNRYDPKVVAAFMRPYLTKTENNKLRDVVKEVGTHDLKSGMTLARDLISKDGLLLVPKGGRLDDFLINKLKAFEKSINDKLWLHINLSRFDSAKDVHNYMVDKRA